MLAIVLAGWSRAGADGGAVVVFAAALTVLELRQRRFALTPLRLALAATAAVAAVAAVVGLDLLLGGSDHVTRAVRRGPGSLLSDWGHRLDVSWAGATASWHSILVCVAFLCVLAGFALRRPRPPAVDAFLVGLAVSLLVNDTPTDVIGFGALGCATLVAWGRLPAGRLSRLAAVRRPAILLLLLLGLTVLAAGCGGARTVSPTAETVIGTLPQTQTTAAKGDPTAGKAVFASNGCGGCHTFKPAGTNGERRPRPRQARRLREEGEPGPLSRTSSRESIKDPSAYIEPGFPNGVMPTGLRHEPHRAAARRPRRLPDHEVSCELPGRLPARRRGVSPATSTAR